MIKDKEKMGILAAFAANVIFGMSNYFSVVSLKYAQPMAVLAVRFTVSFLIMVLLGVFGLVKIDLKGKKLHGLILMSIAQPFLYFICELYGISITSSAMSGVIIAMTPVAVIFLSRVFLEEKANIRQMIFAAVSIAGAAGVSLLNDSNGKSNAVGIAVLIAAVFFAAIFNILSRKESKNFSPAERVYVMFGVSCIGFNMVCLGMYGKEYFNMLSISLINAEFIFSVLYLSVISSIVAFLLYNYATTKADVIKTSSFSNIIPVVSVLMGVTLLKEDFNYKQIICAFFIVLGVWGVNFFGIKDKG